jgi:hypothetical protein
MTKKPLPINGARSVMAGRKEPPDSLDWFPTPPWATRALASCVLPRLETVLWVGDSSIWEPAAGEGHMAEVLREYSPRVHASDVFDYGRGYEVGSFTGQGADLAQGPENIDWIITNPPFNGSIDFVLHALEVARLGVAMFIRTQWYVEGIERYERIFRDRPPTLFAPFVERVNLCKGRWDPDGTTATAYCWLVWEKISYGMIHPPKPTFWIPPGQRKRLSHPDDRARFAAWSLPHGSTNAHHLEAAE